jgi:hypothetical protein
MRWRQRRGVPATLVHLLLAIALATVIGIGRGHAEDPKGFEFVDPSPATVAPKWNSAFSFDIAIRNGGAKAGLPTPVLIGDPDCTTGRGIEFPDKAAIDIGTIAIRKMRIAGGALPATCYVELQTSAEKEGKPFVVRSLKQFKLTQRFVGWRVLDWLIATACASLLATIIAAAWVRREQEKAPCKLTLGSPAWDFSKSWASTLTLAGGIVSAALAVSAVPELTQHASKAGYATLLLLFSLLALFAPLPFFLGIRGGVKNEKPFYEGNGVLFFITCLMTLTAGLGQVAMLGLLLDEIFRSMWSYFWVAGLVLVGLAWICLACYAVVSMRLTFELDKKAALGAAADGHPSWPLL